MTDHIDGDGPCPVCVIIMNERAKEEATRIDWVRAEEEFAALCQAENARNKDSNFPITERSPTSNVLLTDFLLTRDEKSLRGV